MATVDKWRDNKICDAYIYNGDVPDATKGRLPRRYLIAANLDSTGHQLQETAGSVTDLSGCDAPGALPVVHSDLYRPAPARLMGHMAIMQRG